MRPPHRLGPAIYRSETTAIAHPRRWRNARSGVRREPGVCEFVRLEGALWMASTEEARRRHDALPSRIARSPGHRAQHFVRTPDFLQFFFLFLSPACAGQTIQNLCFCSADSVPCLQVRSPRQTRSVVSGDFPVTSGVLYVNKSTRVKPCCHLPTTLRAKLEAPVPLRGSVHPLS